MMSHPITVNLKSGNSLKQFTATNSSGNTIQLSNDGTAPGPMEAVLMAAAGCSTIDIVMILEKMREQLHNVEVEVKGERREEIPRVYTSIHLHYKLYGENLDTAKAERAIKMSLEKYCSVSLMLEKAATIDSSFEIIDVK